MNLIFVIHIATIVANLALGIGIWRTNPKRLTNQCFLVLSTTLSLWLVWLAISFMTTDAGTAALSVRGAAAVGCCLPIIFNGLRLSITRRRNTWHSIARQSAFWLVVTLGMAGLCYTRLFMREAVIIPDNMVLPRPVQPVFGPGNAVIGVVYSAAIVALVYLFGRDIRRSRGIARTELQFVMLGCGLALFFGLAFAVLIPMATGNSRSLTLGPLAVLALNVTIAHGIATQRIMEVGYILRRVTAQVLLFACLISLYSGVLLAGRAIVPGFLPLSDTLPHLLAALSVAFSMAPAHGLMQRFANTLFVHTPATDVAGAVKSAGALLQSIGSVDVMCERFSKLIKDAVGTDRVEIFLSEGNRFTRRFPRVPEGGDGEATGPSGRAPRSETVRSLEGDNPLVQAVALSRSPLVAETIQRLPPSRGLERAADAMRRLDTAAATAVRYKGEVSGIVLLGPRLSGRVYGTLEQDALAGASDQLGVAVENARLYTELEDSKIYNDILVDNLVSGVIAANNDGIVTVCNREALRILDLRQRELLQQPINVLPTPLVTAFDEALQTGSGIRNRDVSIRTETTGSSSGNDLPLQLGSSVFRGHKGTVSGVLIVFNDLTLVKKLETQVRHTTHLASLGTLSAGMAHEIKNPLVTLKTFSQLLPERYQDAEFRETFTTLVGKEVNRIDSIVNQLLRFGKPANAKLRPIVIQDILEQCIELVRAQVRQKGIDVATRWESRNNTIAGDPDLLEQVFVNFFLNAVDAMRRGGMLTVSTEIAAPGVTSHGAWKDILSKAHVSVTVHDTGSGIKREDLGHIFDPFFTTKSTGTGLGLSVAHGIIQEHNAILDVESEIGRGTQFHVAFPLLGTAKERTDSVRLQP
jgi:signal transduction histidine kinase